MQLASLFITTADAVVSLSPLPQTDTSDGGFIRNGIQIVIGIIALLALLFIVIGGMRYVFSQGDPGAVSKAKGTIVFALVGLIIAIFAQALVGFVIKKAT